MDQSLQMANLLFHCNVFLEFSGSRGIFGFAINPPIALYYIQGLNTTAVHGHAALFGVYGILGIGTYDVYVKGACIRRDNGTIN